MNSLFGSQPTMAPVATDKVLPLHFFEDSPLVQGNNMAVSMVFDEVLDPETLRQALDGLVRREGWEKLGGRLRKNAAGKIEWHIPTEFTAERPAINYAHIDHGIACADHPDASRIPKSNITRPAVVGDPDALEGLAWESGYQPNGIKDYLTVDKPVLGLRVHSFNDRTIAVIQWQHVAFDALGLQYVLEAWILMLWGKQDQVLSPCSYDTDPFEPIAQGTRAATETHLLSDRRVGLGGALRWGLGYGVDMLLRAKDNRMVCIPKSYWQPQMEKALVELRQEAETEGKDPAEVFLTEGDIITAWILRSIVASMEMPPDRLVAGSMAMSLRKAFENDLIPPSLEHPYVGNAFGWSNVLMSAGDMVTKPLSHLARQVRRAINEQGTKEQHIAYFDMVRKSGTGLPIAIFGNGGMAQIGLSNWSKAGLFDADFSPARKTPKADGTPCKPVYVQENHGPIKPADGFFIFGKDDQGTYWTSACKVKGQWAKFEEMLEKEFETGV